MEQSKHFEQVYRLLQPRNDGHLLLGNQSSTLTRIMRILLFDIDGTLLLTNGGGSGALKKAVEAEFGIAEARTDLNFSGRTDRSLLSEILEINQLESSEENVRRLRDCYIHLLPLVLRERGGRVLPGVVPLLGEVQQRHELLCLVMTGNLRETATHKLDFFGLSPYFVEVFGGDHDHCRNELARRTVTSLCERLGTTADQHEIIVIGDTPADIRCGHAVGARVVAVCTGRYRRVELASEHPMAIHEDFSDVESVLRSLVDPW